jgi:MoxR-like ATPase
MLDSISAVQAALTKSGYIAERSLATAIYLALQLQKPLLLEGEAGVGKTEVAKTLARILNTTLIRLQCYEGLDVSNALYEWNYAQQLLYLRVLEASGASRTEMEASLFTRAFLQARPLLQALEAGEEGVPPVLLIDEIDRADEEFEALLLEILSDFQITIPELGTIAATRRPVVIITSNRTREIHDALKRRCLYHWIDYPSFEKELAIIRAKAPSLETTLAKQVTAFMQELRQLELLKAPGIAETLDWVNALAALHEQALSLESINDSIGVLLKTQEDIGTLTNDSLQVMLERSRTAAERSS